MDQTGIAFLDIIFFAMVAGFLILRLRSVLGRRSGEEKPERWRSQTSKPPVPGAPRAGDAAGDNVTPLPDQATAPAAASEPPVPGSIEAGVAAIKAVDASFDAQGFEGGARAAFEMIVAAFAQADTTNLRPLLADPVFESFSAAIRERVAAKIRSGSICFNDTLKQATNLSLPFGGVGPSGMGRYRGRAGFECFTYARSVTRRYFLRDLFATKPPYGNQLEQLRKILK